ncbi:MAG: type II toxin-antitoxin system RelE family toxin [Thermoplasmatota archaeon]
MSAKVVLEGPAQKQFDKAPKPVRDRLISLASELAENPQLGQYIPISGVPNKETLKRWERRVGNIKNLYKLELPAAWRALYTVGSRGVDRIVMILEVADHKAYSRLMRYE